MPAIPTRAEAIEAITQAINDTLADKYDAPAEHADDFASGIYGGILVGYGMSETAFLAVHANRITHLTREVLSRLGYTLTPRPGEMPTNI